MVRPGRRLLAAVAIACLLGLAAFAWGPLLGVPVAVMLVSSALAVIDARQAAKRLDQLKISRTLPVVVGRDLPFADVLALTNLGEHPLRGEIRDLLPESCQPPLATHAV